MGDGEGVHAFFNKMHKHREIIHKWLLMTSKKRSPQHPYYRGSFTPSDAPNELITMCKEQICNEASSSCYCTYSKWVNIITQGREKRQKHILYSIYKFFSTAAERCYQVHIKQFKLDWQLNRSELRTCIKAALCWYQWREKFFNPQHQNFRGGQHLQIGAEIEA